MFGWNYENKRDRIKLFLFLLLIFIVVGFSVVSLFSFAAENNSQKVEHRQNDETRVPEKESVTPDRTNNVSEEKLINEYDQTEKFTKEQLTDSKAVAIQFARNYHSYDSDEPMSYLENSKEYMTKSLYENLKKSPRRETLDRAYLTAKDTDVIPVAHKDRKVIRWNVIVSGEAKSVDETTSETEDWYLVSLQVVDGRWKVEDVKVNVAH
ncbi:hypothetical protein [Alkalihalobacillus sp. TS-13]|uniref:hypothetical protein n=1 Tax=Alkalihalobacillus sp. TS-13 TaxID=2842455 RepID=UPI001C8753A0|nr:hypothetical protein [Alkalihalobacillus sp. TS-13]